MGDATQTILAGIAVGLATGLVAAGAALVARATRTLHLAVGSIVVTGLLVHLTLSAPPINAPLVVALGVGCLVAALLSAALEPLVLTPLRTAVGRLLGLAAAGAIVAALTGRVLGARTIRPAPLVTVDGFEVAGVTVDPAVVAALVIGLPGALLLASASERTRWGRQIRLVGSSPAAAARIGISPGWVRAGALAVSGVVGVIAMAAAAPITFAGLPQAAGLTLAAAAIVVLAEDRPSRAVGVGIVLGVIEALGQSAWPAAGGEVVTGLVVLAALVVRGGEHMRSWGRAW